MKITPKDSWKAVKILMGGQESYHDNQVVMRIQLPNSKLATTNTKNAWILALHFERVYTTHLPIAWDALDYSHQRDTILHIDEPNKWDEFMKVICKLANENPPGLN